MEPERIYKVQFGTTGKQSGLSLNFTQYSFDDNFPTQKVLSDSLTRICESKSVIVAKGVLDSITHISEKENIKDGRYSCVLWETESRGRYGVLFERETEQPVGVWYWSKSQAKSNISVEIIEELKQIEECKLTRVAILS